MKEELYLWMKNLAVFYIIFTAVLHLVPDQKYQRYIRSFMGLILIYVLCAPVFSFLGKGESFLEDFREICQREAAVMEELEAEKLQAFYLREGYEREIAGEVAAFLQKSGINPLDAAVHIEGELVRLELVLAGEHSLEQERGIRDALQREFGIAEENCDICFAGNDGKTVAGASSSGTASGGGLPSGKKEQ